MMLKMQHNRDVKKKSHVLIPFILLGIWCLSRLISCFQSINFIDHLAYKDPRDFSYQLTSRYKIDVSSQSTPLSIFSQTSDAFSDPYILRLLPCLRFMMCQLIWMSTRVETMLSLPQLVHIPMHCSGFTINAPSSGHLKNVIDRKMQVSVV